MNYFSFASMITFFVCVYAIYTVLKISYKSPTTILFALYMSCFALWSLGYVFIYSETNKQVIWFWYSVAAFGWIPASFIRIVLYIYMTQNEFLKKQYWFIFIIALFPVWMLYQQFTGVFLVKDFMMTPLGTVEIIDVTAKGVWFIPLYSLISIIAGIVLLMWGIFKTKRKDIRSGYIWLIISNIIMYFFIMGLNILLPALKIRIPSIGAFTAIVIPLITFYIITRHKFFYVNLYSFENNHDVSIINSLYKLETIFDNIQNGILVVDDKCRIVRYNTYMSSFFSRPVIQGKTMCYEAIHDRTIPRVNCPIRDMDGTSLTNQREVIKCTTYEKQFDVHYYPIVEKGNEIKGYILIFTDITNILQQKKIQEDTERIIRHDLKNHLYAITGYAEFYKDATAYSHEDIRDAFSIIHGESQKMNEIINSSLTLIKLERGNYNVIKEKVSLYLLILHVKISLENMIKQKEITVRYDVLKEKSESFMMYGEMLLLENMFLNLVKNAVESATKGSTVTVSGEIDVDMEDYQGIIVITIHNDAVVPESIRDIFFEKYTTGKSGGTGLGNYTALLIAKAHRGDISYVTDKHKGTTVTVRLSRSSSDQE